jgi:outer membrane protein OmpA-like peptidoglycan-associated protein
MAKRSTVIDLDGYASGTFDFPELLASKPDLYRTMLVDYFLSPMYAAERAVESSTALERRQYCSVLVLGHADRFDVPGVSSEERRAEELKSSQLRAESASAWLLGELSGRLEMAGLAKLDTWGEATNVELDVIACGAADLVHVVPANEDQRKENRRVLIEISTFTPHPVVPDE